MSNRARRNLDEEMQRLTFSRAGVSPIRIDHQIRVMEASNSSMTSRLSLVEGTMQTQQGLLEDAFSQLRTARAENRDLQARLLTRTQDHTSQIQILAQQNENLRNVNEAQVSHLRQEHTGHIHQLTQQQQRELTELRTSLTQTFNQEKQAMQSQHQMSLEAAQRHHQAALETTQRQADMTKQRELFEQAGRSKQEKDDAIRELQQNYEAKLQRKQEEHDTQIAILKGYLESTKANLRKKEQEFAEKLDASQREITTRDQSLARLEADMANKQSAIDQLLETTESQTREITDMKAETQRKIRYFLEEQLGQQTDRRLNELRAEHETRAQKARAQWQAEKFGLDALIEQLQDSLKTATERYENRDSLPQDVEKIEELETRLQQEEQQNEQLQEMIAELSAKIEELEQERGSMVQACQDMSTYPFIPQTVGMNSEAQHYGEYNPLHSQGDNQQFQDYDENNLQNMNIEEGGLNGLTTQSRSLSWQMMSKPHPHSSTHGGQQGATAQRHTPDLKQLLENQQETWDQQAYQEPHAFKVEDQPEPKTTNIVIAEQQTTAEKKLILQEAKLLQNIAELKSERDSIKDALETMEIKRREACEEFQEKLNQMTSKLEDQEAVRLEEKKTLEQALLERIKIEQNQTAKITQLTSLFEQKEEHVKALTQKVDALEEEKKAGMQTMKKLTTLRHQLETELSSRKQEKQKLQQIVKEQRDSQENQTKQILALKERTSQYEEERACLNQKLIDLKLEEETNARLEKELSNLASQLNLEKTARQQEKRKLEESLKEQRDTQENQTQQILALKERISQYEEERVRLNQKLVVLKQTEENNARLEEKLSHLASQLEYERTASQQERCQLKELLHSKQMELEDLNDRNIQLDELLRTNEAAKEDLQNQLDDSKIRDDKLKSTIGEREQDLLELGTKNRQLQEEVDKTAIESEEMERRDPESGVDEVNDGDASEPTSPGGTKNIDSKTDPGHSIRGDATPPIKDKTHLGKSLTDGAPSSVIEEVLYQTNIKGNNAHTEESFGHESEEQKLPKSDDKIDSKQHNSENSDSSDTTSSLKSDKKHERKQPHATLCTEGQNKSRNTGDSTAETNVMMDKSCDRSEEMGASDHEEDKTFSNSRKPLPTDGKFELKPEEQITSDSDNSHSNENPNTVPMQHEYIESTDSTVQESNTSPDFDSPHRSLSNEHSKTSKSTVDHAVDKPADPVLANENVNSETKKLESGDSEIRRDEQSGEFVSETHDSEKEVNQYTPINDSCSSPRKENEEVNLGIHVSKEDSENSHDGANDKAKPVQHSSADGNAGMSPSMSEKDQMETPPDNVEPLKTSHEPGESNEMDETKETMSIENVNEASKIMDTKVCQSKENHENPSGNNARGEDETTKSACSVTSGDDEQREDAAKNITVVESDISTESTDTDPAENTEEGQSAQKSKESTTFEKSSSFEGEEKQAPDTFEMADDNTRENLVSKEAMSSTKCREDSLNGSEKQSEPKPNQGAENKLHTTSQNYDFISDISTESNIHSQSDRDCCRTTASAKPASMVAEKTSGKPDAPASKPNQTGATGNTESGQQTSGKSRKKKGNKQKSQDNKGLGFPFPKKK